MDRVLQKVTKDPRRVERGKKSYEMHMKRLKEEMLEELSSSTGDPTPPTTSSAGDPTPSTPSHTIRSNDTYVYGVGILAVLAIGVCIFFACNTFQPKNKKTGSTTKMTSYALEKYTIND